MMLTRDGVEEEIMFEPLYELIKNTPNEVWELYEEKIRKTINGLSYWKNFDKNELLQQSYIYFIEFCQIYDPYYNGGFIPFNKFLFKNLIMKLRAYIQRYYFKSKREQPSEFSEYLTISSATAFWLAFLTSIPFCCPKRVSSLMNV